MAQKIPWFFYIVSDVLLNKLIKYLWQELCFLIHTISNLSTVCTLYNNREGCVSLENGTWCNHINLSCLMPPQWKTDWLLSKQILVCIIKKKIFDVCVWSVAFHCSPYGAVCYSCLKRKWGWWEADFRILIDRPDDLIRRTKASNVWKSWVAFVVDPCSLKTLQIHYGFR